MAETLAELANTVTAEEPGASYVDKLVGEGKKYKNTEELARAYINADMRIRELRDESEDQATTELMLKQVLEAVKSPTTPANTEEAPVTDTGTTQRPAIGADDVKRAANEAVSAALGAEKAKGNAVRAWELLVQAYGNAPTARIAYEKATQSQGMSKILNETGANDPAAAVQIVTNLVPPTSMPTGSNAPGLDAGSANAKVPASGSAFTYTYCKEIRKKDPSLYRSKEFRAKMEKATAEQGDDFFNT